MPNGFGFEPYATPAASTAPAMAAPAGGDALGLLGAPEAATTHRFADPLGAMPGAPPMGVPRPEAPTDPTQEHSATATRVAIGEALQRLPGQRPPTGGPRPTNPANVQQLARLGLPPAEIALLEQSGGVRV